MKAILQYSTSSGGLYRNIGHLRNTKKDYKITPILSKNIMGLNETIGYRVQVKSTTLDLNADLLGNSTDYYWRLELPITSKYIALGQREYYYSYDGQPARNKYPYHIVQLDFEIDAADIEDYIIPEDLPTEESGLYSDEQNGAI